MPRIRQHLWQGWRQRRGFDISRRPLHMSAKMSGALTAAVMYTVTVSPAASNAAPDDAKDKKHHLQNGKGFTNPWDSWKFPTSFQIMKELAWRRITGKNNTPDTRPPNIPEVHEPKLLPSRATSALRATWLGHASYYVEFPSGLRILTDPVFSDRCSPSSYIGPKRYTATPCKIEDIQAIDAVVISHNHYDHLDYPTIVKVHALHPNVHFFVPLGNKSWFTACGIDNVTELDWWDEIDLKLALVEPKDEDDKSPTPNPTPENPREISARIGFLPCQHQSNRGLFDRMQTLWGSWSIESGGKKLYFAGDTAYRTVGKETPFPVPDDVPVCPAFAEIGKFRGPFDLGLIPIGAYKPRWIFSMMHADPYDAVAIFKHLGCKRALAMHWGTWVLTEEDVLEPPKLLKDALKREGIAEEGIFDICELGESREFA